MNMQKQLGNALAAHRMWKDRLKRAIDTGATEFQPSIIKMDDQCDFGKWLHHEIPQEMRQTEIYQTVVQIHADFHRQTAAILEMALAGRQTEAEKAMGLGSEWAKVSSGMVSELLSWRFDNSNQEVDHKALSTDKIKTLLTERARALVKSTEVQTGEMMQLVVFSLANESYGIATELVEEVQSLRDLTPVPCTPDFVVGVINIRGSIYSVIDIRGFFGVAKKEMTDATKVILVNAAGLEVGILADNVSGATSVPVTEIKPPLAAQTVAKDEYIHGVTRNMLIILNLEALLSDDRLIVHEEI